MQKQFELIWKKVPHPIIEPLNTVSLSCLCKNGSVILVLCRWRTVRWDHLRLHEPRLVLLPQPRQPSRHPNWAVRLHLAAGLVQRNVGWISLKTGNKLISASVSLGFAMVLLLSKAVVFSLGSSLCHMENLINWLIFKGRNRKAPPQTHFYRSRSFRNSFRRNFFPLTCCFINWTFWTRVNIISRAPNQHLWNISCIPLFIRPACPRLRLITIRYSAHSLSLLFVCSSAHTLAGMVLAFQQRWNVIYRIYVSFYLQMPSLCG